MSFEDFKPKLVCGIFIVFGLCLLIFSSDLLIRAVDEEIHSLYYDADLSIILTCTAISVIASFAQIGFSIMKIIVTELKMMTLYIVLGVCFLVYALCFITYLIKDHGKESNSIAYLVFLGINFISIPAGILFIGLEKKAVQMHFEYGIQ